MQLNVPRIIKGWSIDRPIKAATAGFTPNSAGPGRKYAIENEAPCWLEAFLAFGLTPVRVEPDFKTFTGVHSLPGSFTHTHIDTAPDGLVHVRCNVLLEKPAEGGMPVIDGEVLDVDVGDLWIVLASMEEHGSTPISSPKRVIKSFGGLVPINQVQKILNQTGDAHV
jgi:hypothetical protein